MISSSLRDIHRAATLFAICLALLIFGAVLGLNSWPGASLFPLFLQPSIQTVFIIFGGYSLLVSTLFWAGCPSLREQRSVFVAWPVVTLLMWMALRDTGSFGWVQGPGVDFDAITLLSNGMGLPALVASVWRAIKPRQDTNQQLEASFRWLLIMLLLFILVPRAALDVTVSLHPHTYDLYALKFDAAAGWHVTPSLIDAVHAVPGMDAILRMAYGLTPLGFFALALMQLRGKPAHVPHALLLWVGLTMCALCAYHVFPITGPKYVFGESQFLAKLRLPDALPLDLTAGLGPNPRNGMPSMHFGWVFGALVVWLLSPTKLWSRLVLFAMTACVAAATLYMGEHYVVDLIVAVPFVLGAIALTTTGVPFSVRERWQTVLLGFGTWLAWVLLMRTQINFFIPNAWACWVMLALTAAVALVQVRAILRFRIIAAGVGESSQKVAAGTGTQSMRSLGFMFFASGAAALVYQVLFAKELALVFGSTATATFTVLATFLGGMAIGSLAGGILAARVSRPIVAYALVELAIGAFCIATPALFDAIQSTYVFLAADLPPGAPILLVLRVALGAGVLLIPTVLMGVTLPLLAQALNAGGEKLGGSVAWLYACNTAGAAVGALLTSYAVIPALGVRSTTLVAAAMNFMVALAAFELAKSLFARYGDAGAAAAPAGNTAAGRTDKRVLAAAWCALGIGGVLSLGLEVVYVHLLSIVAGNSVYAFGLMLATFLVGLSIGGEAGRRIIGSQREHVAAALAVAQLLLAATVAAGAWGWDLIPAYFASFAGYPLVTTFGAREAVRGMVCALVMVPPTIFIGASYTLAMELATRATEGKGIRMVGVSAAINTLGNIAGVLIFGFVLLPWIGGLHSGKVVALVSLGIAAVVTACVTLRKTQLQIGAAIAGVAGLVLVSPKSLDYDMLSTGANVYFAAQRWGEVVDHSESIDGGLTLVTRRPGEDGVVTTLLTNGKFQGNDAKKGEVQAQIGFAALPLLHQSRRENAMVIGYGTGATTRVFHDAGFKHIDLAELSRDIVNMADSHFASINGKVSVQDGVQTHITDGRNLLLLTKRQYDIVSIEITSIWFAGAASLYNRDFYQLVRTKLRPDGVLQQWIQLHHLSPTDLLTIIGTLRSEFQYVSLYVVGGQGILIATNDQSRAAPLAATIRELDTAAGLAAVRELAGRKFSDIAGDLLLTPDRTDVLLDKIGLSRELWISTDNNLRLEYSTPKANAAYVDQSFERNLQLLKTARNWEDGKIGMSEGEADRGRAAN